jgi:hypothetical protein
MDLVEDHQRAPVLGALTMQYWVRGHLRVGHRDAVEVGTRLALRVGVLGVDRDPEPQSRLRPLMLEVLSGRDDGQPGNLTPREKFGSDRQGVGGLACAWRRYQQEIAARRTKILVVGVFLPATETYQQVIPKGSPICCVRCCFCFRSTGPHEGEILPASTGPRPPGAPDAISALSP